VKLARLRFALAVRTALVARLDPGGPDDGTGTVWFDRRRLEPGDEWELDIVEALHTCEAAVLLLTPDALESPWVLREATVLGDRRSRWPGLRLVPVLFAGTTYETLGKNPWWAALDITRWQPVQAPHGDFEGDNATDDLETIVDAVVEKLAALSEPRDPSMERWSEEVRAFLSGLADRRLTIRLTGAAAQLRLRPPVRWDEQALGWLARALLQTDVAEVDDAGHTTYPLFRALSRLVPDDPAVRPREVDEQDLCVRMQPLAAPPAAAVAVGSARLSGAAGGRPTPVMLQADSPRLAELAARRASCDEVRLIPLSGITSEEGSLAPTDATRVEQYSALAERSGLDVCVVLPVHLAADDDVHAIAQGLVAQLPERAALVAVIGRDSDTPAERSEETLIVTVTAADEAAALQLSSDIEYVAGREQHG
jgi:hypothetical protein